MSAAHKNFGSGLVCLATLILWLSWFARTSHTCRMYGFNQFNIWKLSLNPRRFAAGSFGALSCALRLILVSSARCRLVAHWLGSISSLLLRNTGGEIAIILRGIIFAFYLFGYCPASSGLES